MFFKWVAFAEVGLNVTDHLQTPIEKVANTRQVFEYKLLQLLVSHLVIK